jgi:hypothetical protein
MSTAKGPQVKKSIDFDPEGWRSSSEVTLDSSVWTVVECALPERFAVRRALSTHTWAERRENFHYFSRQGYASDLGHAANLCDNARVASGNVRRPQQALSCCEALVLLGVNGTNSIVLYDLVCGKPMRQSWHTYLTNHMEQVPTPLQLPVSAPLRLPLPALLPFRSLFYLIAIPPDASRTGPVVDQRRRRFLCVTCGSQGRHV